LPYSTNIVTEQGGLSTGFLSFLYLDLEMMLLKAYEVL